MNAKRRMCVAVVAAALAVGMTGASASPALVVFSDDFGQPNGPPEKWTVAHTEGAGDVRVEWGELSLDTNQDPTRGFHAPSLESWAYAGAPAEEWVGDVTMSVHIEWFAHPNGPQSRFGGIVLYASKPADSTRLSGYTIGWCDSPGPSGYVIHRWEDGQPILLASFEGDAVEPAHEWLVQVDGNLISLTVNDDLILTVKDGTYRTGFAGVWLLAGAQHAHVDNVVIHPTLQAKEVVVDPGPPAPKE